MVKKAFLKTVEMLIVIVLSVIFIIAVLPTQEYSTAPERRYYLANLEKDSAFREVIETGTGCLNSTASGSAMIKQYLPRDYDYMLCFSDKAADLPKKSIFVDTIYYAGNQTALNPKIVRLYYWKR